MLRPRKTGGKDTCFLFKRKSFLENLESLIIVGMEPNRNTFSDRLLAWYNLAFRPLPWRETRDPYAIWLSEIILQQTRVDQGLAYYHRFLELFPTVLDLANAPEDDVLRCWQGLGYYSRARNLHAAAKMIRDEMDGNFPSTHKDILSLKGVGPYTAAAISSIAFQLPHAVVDGNVYRFLSRLFGIETPIDSPKAHQQFSALAQELLDVKQPGNFNQAMMEFGATVCKPAAPLCEECVFRMECVALRNSTVRELPIKSKKTKIRKRYFYFLVMIDGHNNVLIERRTEGDIWTGLYQFPLIETAESTSVEALLSEHSYLKAGEFVIQKHSSETKHILSHQHIHARFIHLSVNQLPQAHFPGAESLNIEQLAEKALPRLITRYLETTSL
ncbi:MAG: hypothetical protein RLZZ543_2246 [Bacteroidota bacterium]